MIEIQMQLLQENESKIFTHIILISSQVKPVDENTNMNHFDLKQLLSYIQALFYKI